MPKPAPAAPRQSPSVSDIPFALHILFLESSLLSSQNFSRPAACRQQVEANDRQPQLQNGARFLDTHFVVVVAVLDNLSYAYWFFPIYDLFSVLKYNITYLHCRSGLCRLLLAGAPPVETLVCHIFIIGNYVKTTSYRYLVIPCWMDLCDIY